MNPLFNYTEKDIQDYLDGNFGGDVKAFEIFLEENDAAKKILNSYRLLYTELNKKTEATLSFNLEETLVKKLAPQKGLKTYFAWILNGSVALIAITVLVICWNIFRIEAAFTSADPAYLISIPLLIIFIIAWHGIDIAEKKRKLQSHLL